MELTGIYTQLGILFLLMFFGYLLGKIGVLKEVNIQNFTSFIVKVATPALIIDGMLIPLSKEKVKLAVTILIISVGIYALTYILARVLSKLMSKNAADRSVYSFAIMFSNVGFMGYPVLGALFGEEAIFMAAIYNITFNVLLYTLGIHIIKSNTEEPTKFNLKSLMNPGTIASIIGFILFLMAIKLPTFVTGSIEAVAGLCTPLSMITIGAMLSALPFKKMFNNKSIYFLTFVRLIALPVMVLGILKYGLKIDNLMLVGIPTVIAGMPVAANTAMMIKEYGNESELASQCIFLSTLLSALTIPLLAQLL